MTSWRRNKAASPVRAKRTASPEPSRPRMPRSYGLPTDLENTLAWGDVGERLASSRNYWVGTTRPDGRPHSMPVWGVWLDETFYFSMDRGSQKGRNLTINPGLVVHLESGDDVVVLEGVVEEVTDSTRFKKFADAYEAKYQWRLEPHQPGIVVYALSPRVAFAWRESNFARSASCWVFR